MAHGDVDRAGGRNRHVLGRRVQAGGGHDDIELAGRQRERTELAAVVGRRGRDDGGTADHQHARALDRLIFRIFHHAGEDIGRRTRWRKREQGEKRRKWRRGIDAWAPFGVLAPVSPELQR